MKKILVTGGTVFVSKNVAEYFAEKGHEVYILNRDNYEQPKNTKLIKADRNNLGDSLRNYNFDVVLDVTAYTKSDVKNLLDALNPVRQYVLISSSAVYPETLEQPFNENQKTGRNAIWKDYGTNKIEAEEYLFSKIPDAYVIRPPYLYGPQNNLYREAFVFDCAEAKRTFFVPKDGSIRLQFFYIKDFCQFIDIIIEEKPQNHIFNVGNEQSISVLDWVKLCYEVVGADLSVQNVYAQIEQRNYFSFYDYEYALDVSLQKSIFPKTTDLKEGLKQSYLWYKENKDKVNKRDYFGFIDGEFVGKEKVDD